MENGTTEYYKIFKKSKDSMLITESTYEKWVESFCKIKETKKTEERISMEKAYYRNKRKRKLRIKRSNKRKRELQERIKL